MIDCMIIGDSIAVGTQQFRPECVAQVEGQYMPVFEDVEMMRDPHWDGYVQCGVDSYVAIRERFYGVEE